MAKFAIECPVCGRYAEGKTGFFARKKIECSCGNIIDVRTDKLAARECLHCGSNSRDHSSNSYACSNPSTQDKIFLLSYKEVNQYFSTDSLKRVT